MRAIVLIFALVGAACAAEAREATARASLAANPGQLDLPAAEIEIDVAGEQTALWRGTLRVAGSNGYASFSQSKSEFVGACAGEGIPDGSTTSSESLNFSLNRYNWQQNRDAFSISVNWVRPLPPCDGHGTTTVGFSRNITLAAGQTIELDGGNGLSVKLVRSR
jgi:hypothetical protein